MAGDNLAYPSLALHYCYVSVPLAEDPRQAIYGIYCSTLKGDCTRLKKRIPDTSSSWKAKQMPAVLKVLEFNNVSCKRNSSLLRSAPHDLITCCPVWCVCVCMYVCIIVYIYVCMCVS